MSCFSPFLLGADIFPRLFSKDLALKDLPRLYKAADAFVLPTRGSPSLAKSHPRWVEAYEEFSRIQNHVFFFFKRYCCSLGCENSILRGVIVISTEIFVCKISTKLRGKTAQPSRWRMGTASCGGNVYGTSCDCHKLEWIYCHLTSRFFKGFFQFLLPLVKELKSHSARIRST